MKFAALPGSAPTRFLTEASDQWWAVPPFPQRGSHPSKNSPRR